MQKNIVEVKLDNGATALVVARQIEGGASKVGAASAFDLDAIADVLEGISTKLQSAFAKAAPDQVSVELGLELVVKAGKLTALVVEGQGAASLKVGLQWNRAATGG